MKVGKKHIARKNDKRLDGFWLGRVNETEYQLVHIDAWNRNDVQWTERGFTGARVSEIKRLKIRLAIGKVTPVSLSFKERGCLVLMPTLVRKIIIDQEKEAYIQKEWVEREEKRKQFKIKPLTTRPGGI